MGFFDDLGKARIKFRRIVSEGNTEFAEFDIKVGIFDRKMRYQLTVDGIDDRLENWDLTRDSHSQLTIGRMLLGGGS